MNLFQKITFWVGVAFLSVGTLFQGLSLYALSPYFFLREYFEPAIDFAEIPWLLPVWIAALILVPAATVLCWVFHKNETVSLGTSIGAGVSGVLSLVVGLTFRNALPVVVGTKYDQGIDAGQFVYCYLTTVIAAVLIAIVAGVSYYNCREQRIRLENEQYTDQYDYEETTADTELAPARKLKKSQRVAQRKNQD